MQEEIKISLEKIGEDPNREGLIRTPDRVDKSLRFLTQGYSHDIEKVINGAIYNEEYDEKMGLVALNKATIPFKLSYNTLLMKGIIKEL